MSKRDLTALPNVTFIPDENIQVNVNGNAYGLSKGVKITTPNIILHAYNNSRADRGLAPIEPEAQAQTKTKRRR